MNSEYEDYFKNHYKYSFSPSDTKLYKQWFHAQWEYIKKTVNIKGNSAYLELGSSIGGFYDFLHTSFNESKYLGIEVDTEAYTYAMNTYGKKLFKNSPFENLSIRNKFEYIFAFEVLEHVSDPHDVIKKMHKHLNKDGVFIGTSPYPFTKNIVGDKTHKYVLHPATWKALFYDAGFSSVETHPMSFIPFVWRLNRHLNIKLPFYISFPFFISTTLIIARK